MGKGYRHQAIFILADCDESPMNSRRISMSGLPAPPPLEKVLSGVDVALLYGACHDGGCLCGGQEEAGPVAREHHYFLALA